MTPLLFGLIAFAAVLHATWNALLKGSTDPLRLAARALGVTTLVGTPVAVAMWFNAGRPGLPPEAWELAALSAIHILADLTLGLGRVVHDYLHQPSRQAPRVDKMALAT